MADRMHGRGGAARAVAAAGLAAALLAGCTAETGGAGDSALDRFLAVAPDLAPCTPETASARLGIPFAVEREGTYTTFYTAPGAGQVASYAMRMPRPGAAPENRPMISARMRPGAVDFDGLVARFGPPDPDAMEVQPAGGPTYFSQRVSAGRNTVTIGAGLDDPPTVTHVVVDCP